MDKVGSWSNGVEQFRGSDSPKLGLVQRKKIMGNLQSAQNFPRRSKENNCASGMQEYLLEWFKTLMKSL